MSDRVRPRTSRPRFPLIRGGFASAAVLGATIFAGLAWAESDPPMPPQATENTAPTTPDSDIPRPPEPFENTADAAPLAPDTAASEPAAEAPDAPDVPDVPAATEDAAPAREPEPVAVGATTVRPSQFQSLVPGRTSADEVLEKWGEPEVRAGDNVDRVWIYRQEPFKRIAVQLKHDVVASILIDLENAFRPEALAERLQLTDIDAIDVVSARGETVGRAFPERGVVFSFNPDRKTEAVAQVLIEPISAELFLQRAESRCHELYGQSLSDLETAALLAPDEGRIAGLRGEIQLRLGKATEALASAEKAIERDAKNMNYHVLRSRCLSDLGKHEEAVAAIKQALSKSGQPDLAVAQGMAQLAELLIHGPEPNYALAVKLNTEAIRLADPLAGDKSASVAKAANRLLVETHLATAQAIGWGHWQAKESMVPKWIEKANAFADAAPAQEGWRQYLQYEVVLGQLAAHAGFSRGDPEDWVKESADLAEKLADRTGDEARRQHLRWRQGEALADAAEIAHLRKDDKYGLEYAERARADLEASAESRRASWHARYRLGRLYFVTGTLYATHRQDHEKALEWYGKAAPLLVARDGAVPADPGRLGESLVSMGVSYWEVGLRQKAVELTERGAGLMKRAAEDGLLPEKALAIPFGNLASMHEALGHAEQAASYEAVAEKHSTERK